MVALVDGAGNVAASYGYDVWGALTSVTERFANGWTNPYRYDGYERVRYDAETGLYWMSCAPTTPHWGGSSRTIRSAATPSRAGRLRPTCTLPTTRSSTRIRRGGPTWTC